jgi:predicted nucleotidyltransferase
MKRARQSGRGEPQSCSALKLLRVAVCLLYRRLTGPVPPQITEAQKNAVRRWAKDVAPKVSEVRLFGSRARGCARPDSDVDLAVTIDTSNPGVVLGVYQAEGENWEKQLTSRLGMKVHIGLYNDPVADCVRKSCDACSVRLF